MKKIKNLLGVFLVAIAFGLCIPNNVTAEEVNTEEVMSEDFKSYLNENFEYEIKSLVPTDEIYFQLAFVVDLYAKKIDFAKINIDNYSNGFTEMDFTINYEQPNEETHKVKIKYIYDEVAAEKIESLLTDEVKNKRNIEISDLELIRYYDFIGNNYSKGFSIFSSEMKTLLNYNNVNFNMAVTGMRTGRNGLKGTTLYGTTFYTYNNVVYYTVGDFDDEITIDPKAIMYVPTDTENTVEAVKNAALERISANYDINDIKIEYVSTTREYLENQFNTEITDFQSQFNTAYNLTDVSEDDFVYRITFIKSEEGFDVVIKRDSSKMINSSKMIDLLTGIEVSANSPISLDAIINVNKLTSGTEYERIIKILDLTDSVTYDIKLYSATLGNYITKLDDGTFEVKIPIPENLKGKDLTVYYVNEDGKIEEYEVVIKDGYAIFNTNHFSIYTLGATKNISAMNEKNPETGDNILLYIVTSIMSLICLAGISTHIYKKRSKEAR